MFEQEMEAHLMAELKGEPKIVQGRGTVPNSHLPPKMKKAEHPGNHGIPRKGSGSLTHMKRSAHTFLFRLV